MFGEMLVPETRHQTCLYKDSEEQMPVIWKGFFYVILSKPPKLPDCAYFWIPFNASRPQSGILQLGHAIQYILGVSSILDLEIASEISENAKVAHAHDRTCRTK